MGNNSNTMVWSTIALEEKHNKYLTYNIFVWNPENPLTYLQLPEIVEHHQHYTKSPQSTGKSE